VAPPLLFTIIGVLKIIISPGKNPAFCAVVPVGR
jgi:hypothetical protein